MDRHFAVLNDKHELEFVDNVVEWGRRFETSNRVVAQTIMLGWPWDKFVISTVFLGVDYNFYRGGKPLFFETMVFRNDLFDADCVRYATWDEADAGHDAMLAKWRWRRYFYPLYDAVDWFKWRAIILKIKVMKWLKGKSSR